VTFQLINEWENGILSQQPCWAPYFANIVPGMTIEEDVMTITQDTPRFQECAVTDLADQGRRISCGRMIIL
jgi:hypothetical protein